MTAEPSEGEGGRPATNSAPTVAVAFGGGGARGVAHIHVIEVLDELGIRPVAIAGASIGAIMGAAMASGMTGREIRAHTLATLANRTEVWSRFWRNRPATMRDMMADGFRIGHFNIERILRGFLPDAIPHDFRDLQIPAKIVATDYYAQTEIICDSGDLRNAIACSAAIPAVFRPVRRDGRVMVDGGISNPVPFDHLRGLADIVVGVDVVGGPMGDPLRLPTRLDSIFGATQLMMQSIIALKMKEGRPDILLRPEVGRFRVLDFLKAADILDASSGVRDDLRNFLEREFAARGATLGSVRRPGEAAGKT